VFPRVGRVDADLKAVADHGSAGPPSTGFDQLTRGTLTGNVVDQTGATVPRVQISVLNTGDNSQFETVGTESSQYTVPNLPPGPYEVSFEAAGFKKLVRARRTGQLSTRIDF